MTLFVLKIKAAELENIDKIVPIMNNLWKFNVTGSGGADSGDIREGVTISEEELVALDGSRGQVSVIRCQFIMILRHKFLVSELENVGPLRC